MKSGSIIRNSLSKLSTHFIKKQYIIYIEDLKTK